MLIVGTLFASYILNVGWSGVEGCTKGGRGDLANSRKYLGMGWIIFNGIAFTGCSHVRNLWKLAINILGLFQYKEVWRRGNPRKM